MSQPHIVFDAVPEAWKVKRYATGVEYEVEPGVVIEIPHLQPLPEDLSVWTRHPERDLPAGAKSTKIGDRDERKTRLEWPIFVIDSVALAEDDRVVQARLHVLFVMIEHGTIAAVRAPSTEKLAAHRDALLAVFDTVRPHWGDDPSASLYDLYTP